MHTMNNRVYTILLFVTTLFLAACENNVKKVKQLTQKTKEPIQRVINAEIIYSDSAQVKMKINGPIMEHYAGDNAYIEFKKGAIAVFYDKNLKEETRMSAKYVIKKQKENIIDAKNNVVVINEKGEQLNTEHIIWDQPHDKITSDAFVKIRTKDQIIFGEGLESNQSFTKYHIIKPKGIININDNNGQTN